MSKLNAVFTIFFFKCGLQVLFLQWFGADLLGEGWWCSRSTQSCCSFRNGVGACGLLVSFPFIHPLSRGLGHGVSDQHLGACTQDRGLPHEESGAANEAEGAAGA